MKIAFLFTTNGLAGGNFIAYKHALYLSTQIGFEVCLIFKEYNEDNAHFFNTTGLKIIKNMDEALKQKYDLCIATFWTTAFTVLNLDSKKYAYFVQSDERRFTDEYSSELERKNRKLVEYTYKYFPGQIITISKWLVELFKNEFSRNAFYVPNGLDGRLFNTEKREKTFGDSQLRILVEGPAEVSFKRIDFTYACLNRYKKYFNITHIANDNMIRPYWMIDKAVGRQKYEDMPKYYSSTDVIVKLSSVEGFFGPPLEMFGCGGTAITSNVTGYDEYILDGSNALVAQMDNYDSTCEKLEQLISMSAKQIKDLKDEAIATAKRHDWKNKEHLIVDAIRWVNESESESLGDYAILNSIGCKYESDAIELLKNCVINDKAAVRI